MSAAQPSTNQGDRLSDFERAICYHTLPEITQPVTLALVLAYAVVLLEAVLFLIWGALQDSITWTTAGLVAVTAAIVLGIFAFTARAILNDVRQRKALATAAGVPDPRLSDHDLTPDPFGHHVLLRRPRRGGTRFACTDRDGNLLYTVERKGRREWSVMRGDSDPWLEVRADRRAMAFAFEPHRTPGHVEILERGANVAEVQLRYSLTKPTFTIYCHGANAHTHEVRRRSIYQDGRLVGRVYYLRQYLYLDIAREAFHPGVMAYFIAVE